MLMEAQPKNFSDLTQISGLSHGTDGNGTATPGPDQDRHLHHFRRDRLPRQHYDLPAAQGLEPKMAFNVMELTRKGKGGQKQFPPEQGGYEGLRRAGLVYMESCRKIKYMFPQRRTPWRT